MGKMYSDSPKVYRFSVKFFYNTFEVRSDICTEALITGDYSERRDVDEYLMSGEYPEWITFPVVYHQVGGKKLRDLLDWSCHPYIISDRTVKLLEDNHVTGWKAFPVEIYDKKGNKISGYQGLSVIGRSGFITEEGIDRLSDWDGSDIFLIGRAHRATERVKRIFEENKIDAAEFIPYEKF